MMDSCGLTPGQDGRTEASATYTPATPRKPPGWVDWRVFGVAAHPRSPGWMERGQVQRRRRGRGDRRREFGYVADYRMPGQAGEDLLSASREEHSAQRDERRSQLGRVPVRELIGDERAPPATHLARGGIGDHRTEQREMVGSIDLVAQSPSDAGQHERANAGRRAGCLDEDSLVVQLFDADALQDTGPGYDRLAETAGDAHGRVYRQSLTQPGMPTETGTTEQGRCLDGAGGDHDGGREDLEP